MSQGASGAQAAGPQGAGPADDQVLASTNDLVGLFHVMRFGKALYLRILGALVLIFAATGAVMLSARIMGQLVTALTERREARILWSLAAGFLALEALSVLLQYIGRVRLARATIDVAYQIRTQLFAKLERLPIAYFDVNPLGRTLTRITADVEGIETFFSGTLAKVIIALISLVSVMVMFLVLDLRFGALMMVTCLPALVVSVAFRQPVRHWLRTYKKRAAHLNAKLAENLSGLAVIRAFGLENWTQALYDRAARDMLTAGINTMNWNSFVRPLALLLASLPTVVVLWWGRDLGLASHLTLGMLVAFVRLSERFVSPIRTLSQEVQNIQEALVSSERVRKMLLEPEEDQTLGPDGLLTTPIRGDVVYERVSMRYAADGPWALRDVSFHVTVGMRVGIVGSSGSGKTSTVNLLPLLYPYQEGRILVDGIPLTQLSRVYWRSQIGYVGQDSVIAAGTIRANLLMTAKTQAASDADLWAAAQRTGLDQVIRGWPGGLDYELVDGGDNISMGERQLISLTRMLLRDPRILILDEATSSVDEEAQRLIQEATDVVMRGRTTFVIAHRLSTVERCDLILVFAHGRLVEQGTHRELMSRAGTYAQLVASADRGLID